MSSLSNTRGLSLVFALITVTILMVVAGTMTASFTRAANRNEDLFRATQAYYIGRAAVEKALAVAASNGVGYEASNPSAFSFDTNGDGIDDAAGGYEIFALAKELDWQGGTGSCSLSTTCYFVPMPGTGDAGDSCDFEDTTQTWATNEDDECNWNRLSYGQTISVPFFYEEGGYLDGVADPADTLLTTFYLRIRTPDDGSGNRPSLYTGDADDTVVYWEFVGECDEDSDGTLETCYLTPVLSSLGGPSGYSETRIDESDINGASGAYDYVVLVDSDKGIYSGDSTQKKIGSEFFVIPSLTNTYLKLSIISSLTDGTSQIPYLEYQIVVDQEISDSKIVYTAEGKADGKLGTYVRNIQASQSIESDSVVTFVIQN